VGGALVRGRIEGGWGMRWGMRWRGGGVGG